MQDQSLHPLLERIAAALERFSPAVAYPSAPLESAAAFIWHPSASFEAVSDVQALPLELILGVEHQKSLLLENTRRFAQGHPANHALLWGARGTGKSSLVKAIHRHLNALPHSPRLTMVEIAREDIATLPVLLQQLKTHGGRYLLLCDDLSFDSEDTSYKSLKSVLDGGLAGRPNNVLFYATSNRRHLMPRDLMENEQQTAIHPGEAVDEKVSLSDRFGLWLGFHHMDQTTYLAILDAYASHFGLDYPAEKRHAEALEWSRTRGARSGRVAWQYTTDLAGRLGRPLTL